MSTTTYRCWNCGKAFLSSSNWYIHLGQRMCSLKCTYDWDKWLLSKNQLKLKI